jgi:hypothetical protein
MQGNLIVRTDANVISHNAGKVDKEGAISVYRWKVESLHDPAPQLVLGLR